MINLRMSAAQFAAARAVIAASPEVHTHAETGDWTGSFATGQVAMSYRFDGTTLALTVTAKYGMARMASEATIQSELEALLARVNA